SSQEAYSLRSQLRGLIDLQRRYAMDGLSWSERNDLRQRALGLRNEIGQAEGTASGYGRYDNGDRYRTYGNGTSNGYGTYGNGYGTYGNGYGTYGSGTNNG